MGKFERKENQQESSEVTDLKEKYRKLVVAKAFHEELARLLIDEYDVLLPDYHDKDQDDGVLSSFDTGEENEAYNRLTELGVSDDDMCDVEACKAEGERKAQEVMDSYSSKFKELGELKGQLNKKQEGAISELQSKVEKMME